MKTDDIALFHEAVKGAKPLSQDTHAPEPISRLQKKTLQAKRQTVRDVRETEDALFFFSDEYEPLLDESAVDGKVRYLRAGEDSHLLKRLRRGDYEPELFLDLHGLTRKVAKLEIASLLLAAEREHIRCVSIMTGYGTFTLKRQIPRWLVQHPRVRALHQAPREWGGDAAILVLLDT